MPKKRPTTLDKIKIVRDPNAKVGVRIYDKKKLREKSKKAKEKIKDPFDNFGKGAIVTPCRSDPPCGVDHNSKEEALFCFKLNKITPNQPDNWQYKMNGEIIDYFLFKQVFIEYHNWYIVSKAPKESQIIKQSKIIQDKKKKEKILKYVTKRRSVLDQHGYQDFPLIIVNLKSKLTPDDLPDNTFVATSLDELKEILEELEILEL